MRQVRSVGLPELEVLAITWAICFALVAAVIHLLNTSRPPEKKVGMWNATIPSLVAAVAVFYFKYLMP